LTLQNNVYLRENLFTYNTQDMQRNDLLLTKKKKTISEIDAYELFDEAFSEPLERERSVDETSVRKTGHDHVCAEATDRFRGTFLRK